MPAADGFREHLLYAGLADGSIRNYVQVVTRAEAWCQIHDLNLAMLSGSEARALADAWAEGRSSKKLLQASLGHYWEWAGREDPPTKAIRVPRRAQGRCRALEPGDATILAKAARAHGGSAGLAVAIGLYAGLRREEIAKLRWGNVTDQYLSVTGKGNRERDVPVHRTLALMLADYPRQADYVFPGRFGGQASPATIWQWTRQLADAAGVGLVSTHILRHTCLAEINDRTGDLRATQQVAGHQRPETTALYTRARGRRLEAAVAAIDY